MALNLTLLTNQIEAAMKVSQLDPSVQSQRKWLRISQMQLMFLSEVQL